MLVGRKLAQATDCQLLPTEFHKWHDLGVQVKISSYLLDAHKRVFDEPMGRADPVPVLAAWLDNLAKGHGLSPSLQQNSRVEEILAPRSLRLLLKPVVNLENEDAVKNALYDALVSVAESPTLRKLINHRAPDETEVLRYGQVYWNIEADTYRSRLPLKQKMVDGERVQWIHDPKSDTNFAEESWEPRLKKMSGSITFNQMRSRGARLAVLLANELLGRPESSIVLSDVTSTRDEKGSPATFEWPDQVVAKSVTGRYRELPAADARRLSNAENMREEAALAKQLGDSALEYLELRLSLMRKLAKRYPSTFDAELLFSEFDLGLENVLEGNRDDSLAHLKTVGEKVRDLRALHPDFPLFDELEVSSHTLQSVVYLESNMYSEADEALSSAESLAQDLVDGSSTGEELLVLILTMRAYLYLLTDRSEQAEPLITRARKISRKLYRKNPNDQGVRLILALTLINPSANEAERVAQLTEAQEILEDLLVDHPDDLNFMLLLAQALAQTCLFDDEKESIPKLERALELSETFTGRGLNHSAALITHGMTLTLLGGAYKEFELEDRGIELLHRAKIVLENVLQEHPDETTSKNLLGLVNDELEA